MNSSNSDIAGIIAKAIEIEKNGLKTYLLFARETKEVTGKDMFVLLASDEFDHMNLVEEMLKNIFAEEGRGVLPEMVDYSIIEKVVPQLRKKDRLTVGQAGADELVALRTALGLERAAIDYYRQLHEALRDEKMRSLVRRLIEMEEGHYDIIQMQIDSVTDTGFWFDMQEFSLEM